MSDASTTRSVDADADAPPPIPPPLERSPSRPAMARIDVFTRSEYLSALRRSVCAWSRMRSSSSPEAK